MSVRSRGPLERAPFIKRAIVAAGKRADGREERKKKNRGETFLRVHAPTPRTDVPERRGRGDAGGHVPRVPGVYDGEPRSALPHRPSASVSVVLGLVLVVAVPIGEMATVRRDARANGDCRRRQRLHAAVLAERGGDSDSGDGGGSTTRHRARIGADREREPVPRTNGMLEVRRSGIESRGRRRLVRGRAPARDFGAERAEALHETIGRRRTNGRHRRAARADLSELGQSRPRRFSSRPQFRTANLSGRSLEFSSGG